MLNRKIRPDLENLRSRLARWALEVPARATRFHASRASLDQQVSLLLEKWLLRPGEAELSSLRKQTDSLEELAGPLTLLVRRAEQVETEVVDLRNVAEQTPDRDLADWLIDRCVDWQSTLRRLGSNVGRPVELGQDQPLLDRAQNRVRRHAEALRRLDETRQLLARLGDKMETASLRADLPLLRQRLLEEGATASWLADMERAVAPLRTVVEMPPPKPPKDFEEVRRLLAEARRWGRVLRYGEERAFELQERTQVAESDWEHGGNDQTPGLLQEVSQLLADLRRTAADRRAAALALLGKRRRQLAAACGGGDRVLDRELAELATAEAEAGQPETYGLWMERQAAMARHLLDTASARLVDLQEWILRLRQDLADRLDVLEREPLSARAASDAVRLRLDLEGLADPYRQEVQEIFESLETCDRIQLALDEVAEQTRAEREAVRSFLTDLLARNQAFREEVGRSRIEIPDLAPRIESLAEFGAGASLDELRRTAEELERELEASETELVARCSAWIAERLTALTGSSAVLRRLGRPGGALPSALADGGTPSQVTQAVTDLREAETELAGQLAEAEADLESRGTVMLSRLQEVLRRPLRPEVRRDAGDLADWLAERSWQAAAAPEERIGRWIDCLERCDTLLAKLLQEEREARAKAEQLRQRLRELNEMNLDRFCPDELVQRASALVSAIPPEPPSWSDLAGQLDAADELIRLLRAHARRVLAARLDQAVPDLRRQLRDNHDPAYTRRIQTLLEELAAHGEHQLAPAALTAQILLLAPQHAGERGA